jgi:hypothetical protein
MTLLFVCKLLLVQIKLGIKCEIVLLTELEMIHTVHTQMTLQCILGTK